MRNMMLRVFLKFTCDHAGMQGIRAAFRSGTLPAGVVALLRKAGFCFDTRLAAAVLAARERLQAERMRADHDAQTWNGRFEQLRQYWLQYGHAHPRVGQVSLVLSVGDFVLPYFCPIFVLITLFLCASFLLPFPPARVPMLSIEGAKALARTSSPGNAFFDSFLRAHGRTEEVRKLQ